VKALASAVRPGGIATGEPLVAIDREHKVARTSRRDIAFDRLVSSAPWNRLLELAGVAHDPSLYSWNQVLVFNLGFDRKGARDVHWIYYPGRDTVFYRIGFYDNIFCADRLSLYVEVSFPRGAAIDVPALRERVLADLTRLGVTNDHRLVAEHSVIMDPAYVHITRASMAETARLGAELNRGGIHSIGRYGGWTYCSIEDNIVEARALVAQFGV
jgi:protoporphyrinogen oxidase